MKEMRILDEMELKLEFQEMMEDFGREECYQVLCELLKSAEILCEVIMEHEKKS